MNTVCIFALAVLSVSRDESVTLLPSSHREHQSWARSRPCQDHLPLKWGMSSHALGDRGVMGYLYIIAVCMKTL